MAGVSSDRFWKSPECEKVKLRIEDDEKNTNHDTICTEGLIGAQNCHKVKEKAFYLGNVGLDLWLLFAVEGQQPPTNGITKFLQSQL